MQKFGLLLYVLISLYRSIFFHPIFCFGLFLPLFYLFLLQQRRVKGFIRIRQRDRRVRLDHYYKDFYPIWIFVNVSFIVLGFLGLIIYNFEFITNYLLTFGWILPITSDQAKCYVFYYFLFTIGLNWSIQMYIIWFKNTRTIFQVMASQEVTIGAALTTYFGLQTFANTTNPETNPRVHYFYHSYDVFGRGYHFHTSNQVSQSNLVKGALGDRYNPKLFLDKSNYFDSTPFLGFVWANRFEIGGHLTEAQKKQFPAWIKWSSEFDLASNNSINLKDSEGNVIGRMGYDNDKRIIPQFSLEENLEPFYSAQDFDPTKKEPYLVRGVILNSSNIHQEDSFTSISPVASEKSSNSVNSIDSIGEIIVPSSKP